MGKYSREFQKASDANLCPWCASRGRTLTPLECCALASSRYFGLSHVADVSGAFAERSTRLWQIYCLCRSQLLDMLLHSLTARSLPSVSNKRVRAAQNQDCFQPDGQVGHGLGRIRLGPCQIRPTKHARRPVWIKVFKRSKEKTLGILKWRSYL